MNINDLFKSSQPPIVSPATSPDADANGAALGTYDDDELLELFNRIKKEALDVRMIRLRQVHRNILYVLGRQWIDFFGSGGGWKDKRLASWVPRPVTNKCKETVQTIRATFTAVQLGVNVRPNGADPKNVSAAATADDLAPLIHDSHHMNSVLMEFDFWLLVTGNAFFHTFLDYDLKYGVLTDPIETCTQCSDEHQSSKIANAGNKCPTCGNTSFTQTLDDENQPKSVQSPKSRAITLALSEMELAFPNAYGRFDDLPYVVRLRWRTKTYYENHPDLKDLVPQIAWQKSPTDQSLYLFQSLAQHNDMGFSSSYMGGVGLSGSGNEDGITEYEVWYKPCDAYPEGLVFRVIGESGQIIAHLEDTEAIPGPLPYKDADGTPLFTFAHAAYEHVGGRILGSGVVDLLIQKQDILNQIDSLYILCLTRMGNPVWLEPKGAEIQKLNGMPGLVIKWNPLTVGGNAKPERIDGVDPPQSFMTFREATLADMEAAAGTSDIMKGAKPTGVEAFSALQLLDEKSKGRFTPVFQSRGDAYAQWFKYAIELEREFGPDDRTKAVMSSARSWTFKNFKRAQLQGSMTVVVENGSTTPKTSLGMRAAMDQAAQLKMVNLADPDQQYEALKLFGLTKMVPTLDIHIQSALQKQQAFEEWAANPTAMQATFTLASQAVQQYQAQTQQADAVYSQSLRALPPPTLGVPPSPLPPPPTPGPPPNLLDFTPLKWRGWYNAPIHLQEFMKWANGDSVRDLIGTNPGLEPLLEQHLSALQGAIPGPLAEAPKVSYTFAGQDLADPEIREEFSKITKLQGDPSMTPQARPARVSENLTPAPPPPRAGAGGAMESSNRESTTGIEPSGVGPMAQAHGPA